MSLELPTDVIGIILDYIGSNGRVSKLHSSKERDTKLNITLRKYMNGFMGTTIYSASSIKYFRHQCKKDIESGQFYRSNVVRASSDSFFYNDVRSRVKPKLHQCCSKTKSGKRCKNKTFMLFCNCHKDPKVYWI